MLVASHSLGLGLAPSPFPTRAPTLRSPFSTPSLEESYANDKLFHLIPLSTPGLSVISVEPYIFTVDNFLSDDECDELVEMIDSAVAEPSSEKLQARGERTSRTVVPMHDEVSSLRCRLAALANVSQAQMQPLKITRYDVGGVFQRHTDCTEVLRAGDDSATDARVLPNRFCVRRLLEPPISTAAHN